MTHRSIRDDDPPLPATLLRSPSRLQVYRFIVETVRSGQPFPSAAAISAHMGWMHRSSASHCLTALWRLDKLLDLDLYTKVYSLKEPVA